MPEQNKPFRPFKLVDDGERCDPLYEYQIGGEGQLFKFTMNPIPEDHRDWLGMVVTRMIDDAYEAGQRKTRKEAKRHLANLLDTLDIRIDL